MALDHLAHEVARAHRHRRLVDDDGVALHRLADPARDLADRREIRLAIALGRRADRDEDDDRPSHALGEIGRERETAVRDVAGDHFLEPRLVDRHPAGGQLGEVLRLMVDADDFAAEVREDWARDETDVAPSYDTDVHSVAAIIAGARRSPGKSGRGLENLLAIERVRARAESEAIRPRTAYRRRDPDPRRGRRSGCGRPAPRRSASRIAGPRSIWCCFHRAPSRSTRDRHVPPA